MSASVVLSRDGPFTGEVGDWSAGSTDVPRQPLPLSIYFHGSPSSLFPSLCRPPLLAVKGTRMTYVPVDVYPTERILSLTPKFFGRENKHRWDYRSTVDTHFRSRRSSGWGRKTGKSRKRRRCPGPGALGESTEQSLLHKTGRGDEITESSEKEEPTNKIFLPRYPLP